MENWMSPFANAISNGDSTFWDLFIGVILYRWAPNVAASIIFVDMLHANPFLV